MSLPKEQHRRACDWDVSSSWVGLGSRSQEPSLAIGDTFGLALGRGWQVAPTLCVSLIPHL